MLEHAHGALRWIQERWTKASALLRIGYVILSIAIVTVLVSHSHWVTKFTELFEKAHPQAQGMLLIFLIGCLIVFTFFGWDREVRGAKLKEENAELRTRVEIAEQESARQQATTNHLLNVEAKKGIWHRPCKLAIPPMLSKDSRRARFVTVLNFKGGVGKTTLTANLAACLAFERVGLKVLLIDIDFQGTLGSATVDRELIKAQIRHQAFVDRVLLEEPNNRLLTELKVPMNQTPGVDVILAADTLSVTDFQLQARFFLNDAIEPRYQFRKHLHQPEVLDHYDLVIFDCPPRVTTSVVNAVACSDYVLIPTRLDSGSIDAVPRTYQWMQQMGGHCSADLLGVIACHVSFWRDRLTKVDQDAFGKLRDRVQSDCGGSDKLFKAVVAHTSRALGPGNALVASVEPEGREVFSAVVAEFRKRIRL